MTPAACALYGVLNDVPRTRLPGDMTLEEYERYVAAAALRVTEYRTDPEYRRRENTRHAARRRERYATDPEYRERELARVRGGRARKSK